MTVLRRTVFALYTVMVAVMASAYFVAKGLKVETPCARQKRNLQRTVVMLAVSQDADECPPPPPPSHVSNCTHLLYWSECDVLYSLPTAISTTGDVAPFH